MAKSVKRVNVSFTTDQWDRIQLLKGELGDSDAEIIRTIVISWLLEKGYIAAPPKA